MQQATSARLAVVATSTATNIGTIALADQLNRFACPGRSVGGRVVRATGVDEATVRQWVERKAVPMGVHANRLAELIAVVRRWR